MTEKQRTAGVATLWAVVLLTLGLLLTACAGGGKLTDRQKLLVTCDTYTRTLTALASQRQAGNLSEDQVQTVNNVRTVMNPICRGDLDEAPVKSIDDALAVAEQQLFRLQEVQNDGG